MIWKKRHVLPTNLVIYERGSGSLPLANDTFTSATFDTYRLHAEKILQGSGGALLSSGTDVVGFSKGLRFGGLHHLDVHVNHENASLLPMNLQIIGHSALILGTNSTVLYEEKIHPKFSAGGAVVVEAEAPYFQTFRIDCRFFKFRWDYPAVNATNFIAHFVLRSGG